MNAKYVKLVPNCVKMFSEESVDNHVERKHWQITAIKPVLWTDALVWGVLHLEIIFQTPLF